MKQSETVIIKRSQINLNPYNPKRHSGEAVKLQKKNFDKVGFLGGIVWNKKSDNLIDGHRRIQALDLKFKYDGTNDYDIKVECVELDEKEEKEQMTYMAVGNTKADIDLIAEYASDINLDNIGLTDEQIKEITSLNADIQIDSIDLLSPIEPEISKAVEPKEEKTDEEKKAHMKEVKEKVREDAIKKGQDENSCIMLSFSNYENFIAFCDLMGVDDDCKFIKGEDVLKLIE